MFSDLNAIAETSSINALIMALPSKDGNSRKNSNEHKAILERKLWVSRENPEPIFDLSDCNLKKIPSNIFSIVKVFRKNALYLQNNLLSSLTSGGSLHDLENVTVINLRDNKFIKLPSEIKFFKSLEVFDISNNKLQEIPPEIGELRNLKWFFASHNNLKYLPDTIGNCVNLEILDVSSNESLKKLPNTLGRLNYLSHIKLDETVTHPPRDVTQQGTQAILKWFSQELGEEESWPSTSKDVRKAIDISSHNSLQEQIRRHEEMKEKQRMDRLAFEKQILRGNQKEVELHQQQKNQKNKLLEDVKNEQEQMNAALTKLQQKKEIDRALLLKLCTEEEKASNDRITKILNYSKNLRAQLLESWEKERKQEEEMLFSRTNEMKALERKLILESMDNMMREEIENFQNISTERRLKYIQSLASETSSNDKALEEVMRKYEKDHSNLVEAISRDEELQKAAVALLLEKSDSLSWGLARQILIIETQLAELTRLEISKKKLQRDCQLLELSKNRIALTEMLMDLLERQDQRRKVLGSVLQKFEASKKKEKDIKEFWLKKFDNVHSSKSHHMVKFLEAVNPDLTQQLFVHGVFHYLPLLKEVALSRKRLESLDMKTLKELGIENHDDRYKIILAVEAFLASKHTLLEPSAPDADDEPSAPIPSDFDFEFPVREVNSSAYALVHEECVVCLETKSSVLFIPCGHVCCCYKCFKSVTSCPLCRSSINETRELPANAVKLN